MYILTKSSVKGKKFTIITPENKKIHFGAQGYEDYTIHKDKKRKKSYLARHGQKTDIDTPGFWAQNLLWNKPTLEHSIADTEKRHNIKIITP